MQKNIKIEIIEKVKQFITDNDGSEPTKLHLTHKEEAALLGLTRNDIGNLARDICEKGVRKAIQDKGNTIMGMEVQWDAENFKVGRTKS